MGFFSNKEDEDTKSKKVVEESEDEESEESYEYNIECENCGDELCHEIDFGTTVKEYLVDLKCDACGCLLKQ